MLCKAGRLLHAQTANASLLELCERMTDAPPEPASVAEEGRLVECCRVRILEIEGEHENHFGSRLVVHSDLRNSPAGFDTARRGRGAAHPDCDGRRRSFCARGEALSDHLRRHSLCARASRLLARPLAEGPGDGTEYRG